MQNLQQIWSNPPIEYNFRTLSPLYIFLYPIIKMAVGICFLERPFSKITKSFHLLSSHKITSIYNRERAARDNEQLEQPNSNDDVGGHINRSTSFSYYWHTLLILYNIIQRCRLLHTHRKKQRNCRCNHLQFWMT